MSDQNRIRYLAMKLEALVKEKRVTPMSVDIRKSTRERLNKFFDQEGVDLFERTGDRGAEFGPLISDSDLDEIWKLRNAFGAGSEAQWLMISLSDRIETALQSGLELIKLVLFGGGRAFASSTVRSNDLPGVTWVQDNAETSLTAVTYDAGGPFSRFEVQLSFEGQPTCLPRAILWANPKDPIDEMLRLERFTVRSEEDGRFVVEMKQPWLAERLTALKRAKLANDKQRVMVLTPCVDFA